MSYARYKEWLVKYDTSVTEISYEEWLAHEHRDNAGLQRLHSASAVVAGDLPKSSRSGQILQETVEGSDDDLRATLAALARSKMSRIANLVGFVDTVEEKLMRRIQVDDPNVSMDQLLSAARYLRRSAQDDIHTVVEVLETSKSKSGLEGAQFNQFNFNVDAGSHKALENRDSRDRTRSVLDGLIQAVNKKSEEGPVIEHGR